MDKSIWARCLLMDLVLESVHSFCIDFCIKRAQFFTEFDPRLFPGFINRVIRVYLSTYPHFIQNKTSA